MSTTPTPRVFRPPARWSWFYGLAALLALVGFGWTALRAWHARGQSDFALWLTLAALSAFVVPWLAYGWWWTRQVAYRLGDASLTLRAPGAQAVLPLERIVWAGVVAHYDRELPAPPRGWPGLLVGLVAQSQGVTVAFYGLSRGPQVVLEDEDGRVFVLTPADPAAFLEALRARLDAAAPPEDAPAAEAPATTPVAPAAEPVEPEPAPPAAAPAPRAEPVPQTPKAARVPRGAWAVVLLAWAVSLGGAASAYSVAVLLPLGLQYALYGHLVLLGAETGVGHYLFATGREAYAYALWAAGLLAGLGVTWAIVDHLYL